MSFLGLDIGTSGCKAVVYSDTGNEIATAYREYPLIISKHGWAELDSALVIERCFETIREVNSKVQADIVEAICISSQGEAFTPISKNGSFLRNAMVSSDTRASHIAQNWSVEFGIDNLYQITGHTAHPLFTLFKLIWIKQNQPEIWNQSVHFYCFEDLLHLKLGIEPAMSWPLAGRTMLFDVRKHVWSPEILNAIGLDESKLAKPLASGKTVGTIEKKIAESLGFAKEIEVITGGHDQTCSALGAGVTEAGMCMYATGTVECFCPILEKPSFTPELMKNNLCCYDFTIENQYTTVAYSLTGGNILKWFKDEFGQLEIQIAKQKGENPYSVLLSSLPEHPTELLVLPYFTPTGTPYFDTTAKGAIIGLEMTTKKEEIMKALLEGVAFEMRLNLELMENSGMKIKSFIATGGGTRNTSWTQLKADILNKPVICKDISETGCFGAAMLACSAITGIAIKKLVSQDNIHAKAYEPDPERAQQYAEKFGLYKDLYPALKRFW
jgi:xylulokinase